MLRIQHCLDNRLTDGGKVVSLMHRPCSTPQKHYFSASGTNFAASVVLWSEFLDTDPGSGFDSRRYQIFLEVVGLEWGPLSLVSTTEKLLERKSSGSGLERREYGRRDPSR
jgi:hypothetical protein